MAISAASVTRATRVPALTPIVPKYRDELRKFHKAMHGKMPAPWPLQEYLGDGTTWTTWGVYMACGPLAV